MFAIIYKLYPSTILPVACRYQFLKAKRVEVNLKVFDEVRLSWVVAVAVDDLVLEVVAVVPELIFYI